MTKASKVLMFYKFKIRRMYTPKDKHNRITCGKVQDSFRVWLLWMSLFVLCISHIHQHHHFQNTILFNSVLHNRVMLVCICVRTKLGTLNRHGENEMMIMIWWNTKTCVVALFWGFVKEITAQTTSIQTRFVLLSIYIYKWQRKERACQAKSHQM